MKVFGVKVAKEVNDPHNVHLDDLPTFFEKSPGKTIGARSLVIGHLVDCTLNFLFGERGPKAMQVWVIKMKFIPIEIVWPRHPTSHNRIEVRVECLRIYRCTACTLKCTRAVCVTQEKSL
jgi:hypothetical protein